MFGCFQKYVFQKRFLAGLVVLSVFYPFAVFSFPKQYALPAGSFEETPSEKDTAPYVEKRTLSEIWDSARAQEESFSFLRKIPSAVPDMPSRHVILVIFPKITSGLLWVREKTKPKIILGKESDRYPPLVSYEGDKLTLFQLIQHGRRSCEITMTITHGEILNARETAGCADYESKGHLLSKDLTGAKILPPVTTVKKSGAA